MNFSFIQRNAKIDAQRAEMVAVSKALGLPAKTTELLFSRGLTSVQSIQSFLNPATKDFHDPFLMQGMREAVARISQAVENKEKVVIYGDYDADGVCATAILTLYLVSKGLEVYPHIPSRLSEGYGLNIESLERIIEEAEPDLIITCDCGISGKAEVAHVLDLGVDIIVTDHHEISSEVPECIIVNPKMPSCGYPINYLCGAGVAFKLVAAHGGLDAAMRYIDLAAVATVADLVPLLDENRVIVKLGLNKANLTCKGLAALYKEQELDEEISSQDVAYKIAPRINAAGRMGDAYRAFELVTSADPAKIQEVIQQINEDNVKRKALCEEMYNEAVVDLQSEDLVNNRAIVLSHPAWEKGITGILAARIAGDYKRPAFIVVGAGANAQDSSVYKGTCRGFGNINVYELLQKCADLLVEYGGHSQAAGFAIEKEQINAFRTKLSELLKDTPDAEFLPSVDYDIDVSEEEINLEFAKSLSLLEPFGHSNPRPVFRLNLSGASIAPCKSNYRHTHITTQKGLSIMAFNHYHQNQFLLGADEKQAAVEISVNTFGKKESPKTILKGIAPSALYIDDDIARANFFKNISLKKSAESASEKYLPKQLDKLLSDNIYGTLLIAGSEASYAKFIGTHTLRFLLHEFMYAAAANNFNRIIVSPVFDSLPDLSNYTKIIFLDSPVGDGLIPYLNRRTKAKIYIPHTDNSADFLQDIQPSRETFGYYYELLRQHRDVIGTNVFSFYKAIKARAEKPICASGFIAALLVFNELKLIDFIKEERAFGVKIVQGVNADLTESAIYKYISAGRGGAV
ncbi:MAG: single-stranded-DNA-specific exonuclease RecJ [Firmicutes bacterium]|nr:single-stranded-DNA-specific exonuclease RecJ [Bacillota bacterium]